MKHFHFFAPALLGAILVAAPAGAQENGTSKQDAAKQDTAKSQFSVGGSLGVGIPSDLEDDEVEFSFKPGVAGTLDISTPLPLTKSGSGAFIGRVEFSFLFADLDKVVAFPAFFQSVGIDGVGDTTFEAEGNYYTLSLTGNILYESALPGYESIISYGGIGIGLAYSNVDLDEITFEGLSANPDISENGFDFHWQLMAGVDYALNDFHRIGLQVQYVSIETRHTSRSFRIGATFRRLF